MGKENLGGDSTPVFGCYYSGTNHNMRGWFAPYVQIPGKDGGVLVAFDYVLDDGSKWEFRSECCLSDVQSVVDNAFDMLFDAIMRSSSSFASAAGKFFKIEGYLDTMKRSCGEVGEKKEAVIYREEKGSPIAFACEDKVRIIAAHNKVDNGKDFSRSTGERKPHTERDNLSFESLYCIGRFLDKEILGDIPVFSVSVNDPVIPSLNSFFERKHDVVIKNKGTFALYCSTCWSNAGDDFCEQSRDTGFDLRKCNFPFFPHSETRISYYSNDIFSVDFQGQFHGWITLGSQIAKVVPLIAASRGNEDTPFFKSPFLRKLASHFLGRIYAG